MNWDTLQNHRGVYGGGGWTDQTGMRNQKRYDKSVKEEHIDLAFIESFIKLLDRVDFEVSQRLGL